MPRSNSTLLLLSLIAVLSHGTVCARSPETGSIGRNKQSTSDFNYERIYTRKIDGYLVDNVKEGAGADKNIEKAAEWLSEELIKEDLDKNLVRALIQLTSLNKLNDDNKCNRDSYEILLQNDLATKGVTHRVESELAPLRRVQKVVYEYSIEHALNCRDVYPVNFTAKYEQMDKVSVNRVKTFGIPIINRHLLLHKWQSRGLFRHQNINVMLKKQPKYAIRFIVNSTEWIEGMGDARIAYETIESLAHEKQDPDQKFLYKILERQSTVTLQKEKIKRLFNRYLFEPCDYYVRELGPDVFIPARYDAMMLEDDDFKLDGEGVMTDFYLAFAYFQVCNDLVSRGYKSLVENVAILADK